MKKKDPLNFETIEKKLKLASGLFDMAFKMKCFQIKTKTPHLEEREVRQKAYALIEKGCS